jgi:L-arabinonolactonase
VTWPALTGSPGASATATSALARPPLPDLAYDFDPDEGAVPARQVFATVDKSSGAFPDGLTVDAEGGVWSVHNGAGRVVRYAPDGTITHEIEPPLPQPTGCIFGKWDLDVL